MSIQKKTKKAAAIISCAALTIALGATAAFAAIERGNMLVKNENNVNSYSTDNGKTWNNGLPEGAVYTRNSDGSSTVTMGAEPADGAPFMSKSEGGVTSYSQDGGQTWSNTLPDGLESFQDPDGAVGIKHTGGNPAGNSESSLVRNDNGVTSYSTDGGKTWTNGLPEGAVYEQGENGFSTMTVGTPPADGAADSFAVKTINGVTSYSVDGGKTWSENAPEGFTQNSDGSTSFKKK